MSKILAVFGATGRQGGSVISHVLSDPVLSKEYTIRAITRDPSSAKAQSLLDSHTGSKISLVAADLADPTSLPAAVQGAHTVFLVSAQPAMRDFAHVRAIQRDSATAAADACVAAGVARIVYSTLPHVSKISGDKYVNVGSFDGQAEAAEYIRDNLGAVVQSAFVAAGSFMQNWHAVMKPQPSSQLGEDGVFVIARHVAPEMRLPLVDIAETGKWVAAVLADFDNFRGKTVCMASREYSMREIAEKLSANTGKKVVYRQISNDEAIGAFGGDRNPAAGMLVEMMLYQEEFRYFGPDTAEEVRWGVENARGHISTFEEYLEKNPVSLE